MSEQSKAIDPPHAWLTLTEGFRAALDLASFGAFRLALETAPRGDGHPVLVLPGFLADDDSTVVLRDFLSGRGYRVFGWEMGQNTGPSDPDFGARLGDRVEEILEETQERISIIGQSLGGVYAREISKHGAEAIRQIIMLGSPLLGPGGSAKHVEEMYAEMTEGGAPQEPFPAYSDPTVPSTSIYSRLDGIVSWENSIQADHHLAENIEVNVSHIGMAFSPAVLFIIAERLAQHDGDWQPFDLGTAHQRAWQRSLGYLQPAKLLG